MHKQKIEFLPGNMRIWLACQDKVEAMLQKLAHKSVGRHTDHHPAVFTRDLENDQHCVSPGVALETNQKNTPALIRPAAYLNWVSCSAFN
ncbi:MAG: hypothetical protein K0B14_04775 [Anaerolineaceae bacterium]|nr:hypothetical protein [Anaerolineaceae bacterium]